MVSSISKSHLLQAVRVELHVFTRMSVAMELPENKGNWSEASEARKRTGSFLTEKRRENRPDSGRNGRDGDRAGPFSGADLGMVGKRRSPWGQAEMRVWVVWTDSPSGWVEREFETGCLVEAPGVEPGSEGAWLAASTCVVGGTWRIIPSLRPCRQARCLGIWEKCLASPILPRDRVGTAC